MKERNYKFCEKLLHLILVTFLSVVQCSYSFSSSNEINPPSHTSTDTFSEPFFRNRKIGVIYDRSGSNYDSDFQIELFNSLSIALKDLDQGDLEPQFIDLSSISINSKEILNVPEKLSIITKWMVGNGTRAVISLLDSELLQTFSQIYSQFSGKSGRLLTIVTPRIIENRRKWSNVRTICLQMNPGGIATALLNRVEKVGLESLVPILDSSKQLEFLEEFSNLALKMNPPIQISYPVFMDLEKDKIRLEEIMKRHSKHELKEGILLLAKKESQATIEIAVKNNHSHLSKWFSPNFPEHENWAWKNVLEKGLDLPSKNHSLGFGLYSVQFVGAKGWDNPTRRKYFKKFANITGQNPRILSSALAYDSALLIVDHVRKKLKIPRMGLSGEIAFNLYGFRQEGSFFGLSSSSGEKSTDLMALLQKSSWILDDVITIIETIEGQNLIKNYDVATSSLLDRDELFRLVNRSRGNGGCAKEGERMKVFSYDPFTQMPFNYHFNKDNLPGHLIIPNHHGFGLTFSCLHNSTGDEGEDLVTTLQIACTPGPRFRDPVNCFKSNLNLRVKRSEDSFDNYYQNPNDQDSNESTDFNNQQQYYQHQYQTPSFKSYNEYPANSRDGSNSYYYEPAHPSPPPPPHSGGYGGYHSEGGHHDGGGGGGGGSHGGNTAKPAETTKAPAPAPPPAPKLPELRQVLKAAKPFVGSCLGSTTGCAVCVIVLGRLPLGAVPAACTGPCFVGTFGSCGSLLGRVFSETTVICTELFKQGYLDADTFISDAEFGKMILDKNPAVFKGYSALAIPLVERMKTSSVLTYIVAQFAVPWAEHMKFLMGRSEKDNKFGRLIHKFGEPMCNIVGWFLNLGFSLILINSFIIIILTILMLALVKKFNYSYNSNSRKSGGLFIWNYFTSYEFIKNNLISSNLNRTWYDLFSCEWKNKIVNEDKK